MDDYRSEQQNEMEALLSIYTDDVEGKLKSMYQKLQ